MNASLAPRNNERGVALVMALIVLLVTSMIAAVLMTSLNVEKKLTGYSVREAQARNTAEAGIGEAVAHMKNNDIVYAGNPRAVWQVFLQPAGSVPAVGADTVSFATGQPAGEWLDYSTAGKGPDVLTVRMKTNPARTQVYYYDPSLNPPVNTASGSPIYVVNSTGRAGATRRRIESEVFNNPYVFATNGALSTNIDVRLTGNGVVCGWDHDSNTPDGQGENGRGRNPDCMPYENGANDLPGVRCTGTVFSAGASGQEGVPRILANQTGFYKGPWEVLSMTQAQFINWIGPPLASAPTSLNGLIHLDKDNIRQNASGGFNLGPVSGEGFLYVDGDVTINADFFYRGIIYVEGNVKVNGDCWILGALINNGSTDGKLSGGMTILYSTQGIQDALLKTGARSVTMSWRELPLSP